MLDVSGTEALPPGMVAVTIRGLLNAIRRIRYRRS